MPITSKKSKKGRGKAISLNSFLGDTPSGTVMKKVPAMEAEDGEDDIRAEHITVQLPTAPKANRLFNDESIPFSPPFIARLNNLPFDGDEEDIYEFFENFQVISVRLPREDGDSGRVRGFGNVEFESRDDLIEALSMPDPTLKGRRIRIELMHETEQNSQRMNKRGFSNFGDSSSNRDSTDWRRDSAASGPSFKAAPTRSYGYNSGQRETSGWRQSSNSDENSSRNWREDRPSSSGFSSWRNQNEGDTSTWRRNQDTKSKIDNFRDQEINQRPMEERPRLELKPRTLPMPEIIVKPTASLKTTEEKKVAAMPTEAAQVEPENLRAMNAARPEENAKVPDISEEEIIRPAIPDEPETPEAAAADLPDNAAEAERFSAALNIIDRE